MEKFTITTRLKEICSEICEHLQLTYMPFLSEKIRKQSVAGFLEKWIFPNCLGNIVGKHITLKRLANMKSLPYCYPQKFSTALLTVVDSEYKFIMDDVGRYGKDSDRKLFHNSVFYKEFIDN